MPKRRGDIPKLVSFARQVWRQSENYQSAKKMSKSAFKQGWFTCAKCLTDREVIKIDHINAIGKQPGSMREFGNWLEKLFCDKANLQGLCADCHKVKTKEDNKRLKDMSTSQWCQHDDPSWCADKCPKRIKEK